MQDILKETKILDYGSQAIQRLITEKSWRELNEKDRIGEMYNYVRDDIKFGYNISDEIKASEVLKDGYGQCNTKGTLFMALLRATGTPCRIHGFYINKTLQKGAMKGFYYNNSPKEILHSWVEIYYQNKWLNLEGFILDIKYLNRLQDMFKDCEDSFCGYGVATNDFKNPPIDWNENDTYIQKEGIIKDLGIFDAPDDLFATHSQKLNCFKSFVFKRVVRHLMSRNIRKIRDGAVRKRDN